MRSDRSGWVTARSQIAFVVGLVIAVGVIFWLELVQFRNADDTSGDSWVVAVDVPTPPSRDSEPGWLSTAKAVVATGGDAVATTLMAAACGSAAACAPTAPDLASALATLADAPIAWGDDVRGPIALAALSALIGDASSDTIVPAWTATRSVAVAMPSSAISSQFGLRQFAARAATLAGRDLSAAQRLTDLREVFEPADGLDRIGATRTAILAEGLGLILAFFPDTGSVRQLLWRTYGEWPGPLSAAPVSVLALWWSSFAVDGLDAELTSRMASASPVEAAIAILAARVVADGPLLASQR